MAREHRVRVDLTFERITGTRHGTYDGLVGASACVGRESRHAGNFARRSHLMTCGSGHGTTVKDAAQAALHDLADAMAERGAYFDRHGQE